MVAQAPGCRIVIRQRIYNPAQLTPEELKASFIARHETLVQLLRLLAEQKPGHPCQHVILVGPRGMGKTTLGLSFLQAVREDPELASTWQPVPFHEESYDIGSLADLWLAALRHLTRATGEERWAEGADGIHRDEVDADRLTGFALAALLDFCEEQRKRLILFVENLDIVFEQLRDEREVHALRAALMEHDEILLIGSANSVFDAIRSHGEPFYEFFRLVTLSGLDRDECRGLVETLAHQDDRSGSGVPFDIDEGRLETIRHLTGGNPRLLVLACRMLLESPAGTAIEDLERLIDEQTPYFKARIEALPVQARKVFHCLAEAWSPLLAREVADRAKLSSSHASSQLRQLTDKGYVREVRLSEEKRGRYEVGDRFYNLYYVIRFSRTGRARLERLVEFLHQLFGPVGMRHTYATALDALRTRELSKEDLSDWLKVLVGRVARDEGYTDRQPWLKEAIRLSAEKLGSANMSGELAMIVAAERWGRPDMAGVALHAILEAVAGDAQKAEDAFNDLLVTQPVREPLLRVPLGLAQYRQGKFGDALASFRVAATQLGSGGELVEVADTLEVTSLHGLTMFGQGFALLGLRRPQDAVALVDEALALEQPSEPAYRFAHSLVLLRLGSELAGAGREDCAVRAWSYAGRLATPDDPPELRRLCMSATLQTSHLPLMQQKLDETIAALETTRDLFDPEDPAPLRHDGLLALIMMSMAYFAHGQPRQANAALSAVAEYHRPDDPVEVRRITSRRLARISSAFNAISPPEVAEMVARQATEIDPDCALAWSALAETLLRHQQRSRLPDAELCSRRALELAPDDDNVLRTLYAVLRRRRKRKEARDLLRRVPNAHRMDATQRGMLRWLDVFIAGVAEGHATYVKQLIAEAGVTDTMEPLWHAVRAELGEEIGPLPVEVMAAVDEVRRKIAERRD